MARGNRASSDGFNRRKLEDQRREAAEKEAANRHATDAQVLQEAPNRGLERTPSQTYADAVLADDWRCHYSGLLVPVDALSRVHGNSTSEWRVVLTRLAPKPDPRRCSM